MTTPSLQLYPDPGSPSVPPTWEDIELLARHYPAARVAVIQARRGECTREQALVSLVYWFATAFAAGFRREAEALAREVPESIVRLECGCTRVTNVRRSDAILPCPAHHGADAFLAPAHKLEP